MLSTSKRVLATSCRLETLSSSILIGADFCEGRSSSRRLKIIKLPDDTPPTLHEASARARFGAVAGPVPLAFRFFASFVSIPAMAAAMAAMASTLVKFGLT